MEKNPKNDDLYEVSAIVESLPLGGSEFDDVRSLKAPTRFLKRYPDREAPDGGFTREEAELLCSYLKTRYEMAPEISAYIPPVPPKAPDEIRCPEYNDLLWLNRQDFRYHVLGRDMNYSLPFNVVAIFRPRDCAYDYIDKEPYITHVDMSCFED